MLSRVTLLVPYNSKASVYHRVMNRIAELRRLKGWSQTELAEKVGTTRQTILRLENGQQKLTVDWMRALARAFEVSEADILDMAALSELADEVEIAAAEQLGPFGAVMAKKGVVAYRVTGRGLLNLEIAPGTFIAVDTSEAAIAALNSGDPVLVEMSGPAKALVLRQFVHPGMLVTNRPGNNIAVTMSDTSLQPKIVGLILR